MRAYLKGNGGRNRSFFINPDTSIGVIYGALCELYGDELQYALGPSDVSGLFDESPWIYLREDPIPL